MLNMGQLRAAFICCYAPTICCTFHQHLSCCCAGCSHRRFTGKTHRGTAAGSLQIHNFSNGHRAGIDDASEEARCAEFTGKPFNQFAVGEHVDGGRLLDGDVFPSCIQFVRRHHRQ